jgi:hypothetical protein
MKFFKISSSILTPSVVKINTENCEPPFDNDRNTVEQIALVQGVIEASDIYFITDVNEITETEYNEFDNGVEVVKMV